MPETVVLLDDEVFEGETTDLRDLEHDIHSLEVVCWSWVEEHFGIQVRNSGVYVLTRGRAEHNRKTRIEALEALIAAQDRHRASRGEYADRLEKLPDFGLLSDYGLAPYFQLDLRNTESGWAARVGTTESWRAGFDDREPVTTCYAFSGATPAEWEASRPVEQPALSERQPVCFRPRSGTATGSGGR